MERVLLVSRDQHFGTQLKSWLEGFPVETTLEMTSDIEAWYKAREGPVAVASEEAVGESPPPTSGSGPPAPTLILLDDLSMLAKNAAWLTLWKKRLSVQSPEAPPLFLLISGGDGPIVKPELLLASGADDLITRPIDRTILLQKLEVLIARGKSVSPSFLFRLKSEFEVEIGKDCVIEEISDVEIFLKNPLPLRFASHATLHSDLFGEGADAKVDVIVESSEMIPGESMWRVRLRYFGLTALQLSKVRHAIRRLQSPMGTKKRFVKKADELVRAFDPDLASKPALRLAVIDMDPATAKLFESALESQVYNLKLKSFATPSQLFQALLRLTPTPAPEAPAPVVTEVVAEVAAPEVAADAEVEVPINLSEEPEAEPVEVPDFFPSDEGVSFLIRGDDAQIVKIETALEDQDMLLGYVGASWKERPETLAGGIAKDEREAFQEALEFTSASGRAESVFKFHVAGSEQTVSLNFKMTRAKEASGEQPALIQLTLSEAADLNENGSPTDREDFVFDALIVDAGYLGRDPSLKVRILRESFVKAGLCDAIENAPPVYIVSEEKTAYRPKLFHVDGVSHFAYKIADRRHIIDTFAVFAPKDVWKDSDITPTLVPTRTHAHISRFTSVAEVSEFALIIKDPLPFRVGAALRFFSDFLGENRHGVLAKCSSSEPAGDGAFWMNEFVFFGSSEDFQQKIRKYVRSEFARKRSAEAS